MVGERVKQRLDRKPVWRRASERLAEPGHEVRSAIGSNVGSRVPEFENRNFGNGIGAGVVGAAAATIIEDTVGVPFGGSSDILNVRPAGKANEYTVNVNAPMEDMAKVRAFLDSSTGFLSLLTDELDVQDVELVDKRALRDTYEVKLRVVK